MGNLQAFTIGHKHYRMIAHYITPAHGCKADSVAFTRTGLTFATIHSNLG